MQMSHRSVAYPMGERRTFHPRRVCQSWQYPRGHTTAHLFAATPDNTGTQNRPKHSHKQNDDTSTEVQGRPPPPAIVEVLQDYVTNFHKVRRLHLIVVDLWRPWKYNTAGPEKSFFFAPVLRSS